MKVVESVCRSGRLRNDCDCGECGKSECGKG